MRWILAPLKLSYGDVFVQEVVSVRLEVDLGRCDGLVCDDDTLSTCTRRYNNIMGRISKGMPDNCSKGYYIMTVRGPIYTLSKTISHLLLYASLWLLVQQPAPAYICKYNTIMGRILKGNAQLLQQGILHHDSRPYTLAKLAIRYCILHSSTTCF